MTPPVPLIGVTELSLAGRGPKRGYVFDAHRLALPCWADALLKETQDPGAVLLTFDRHFDTVPPELPPSRGLTVAQLEQHAHHQLDPRNYDHILAALQGGVISHAIIVARARPLGSLVSKEMLSAPTLDSLLHGPDAAAALKLLDQAPAVLLDIDLDCFTSPSDADPTTIVPWSEELIRDHLMPRGSEDFWQRALARCVALTFAREPKHCGGLIAGGRLFETAAHVVFEELLQTDLP
ncbi:MAG: UPF0489 family protein [Archangiaceae bacterium]|nr:UPF0489 family protein [Archangiaceae bacterium]